ncbi:DUF4193 domain-containing protein [Arthrobacter sp. ISL-95]|uniref:DUF4193 domain-containing protein n=1 Tax=Arthrobacter sp. ISL-95 TaxID=2819116 RepID=UPI001BE97112|nr:DUF4193 domain-containing protein [Arthrobacter sp. ISL-95]MBT2588562.1 DUF4193 domain-containing protein [Arthrobacter sp. ISL-95]
MATDYDDLRPEVKEAQEQSLEALQTANAPTAKSAVVELEESDEPDTAPAGEIITEELIVEVVPPRQDEFTCSSCFLVHHHSQIAREHDGMLYCTECEA